MTGDDRPAGSGQPVGSEPPKDYLVGSIIALLLCAPWGLIPLVHSIRARRRWAEGDRAGAAAAAQRAKGWIMTFALIWIIVLLLWVAVALHIGGESLGSS